MRGDEWTPPGIARSAPHVAARRTAGAGTDLIESLVPQGVARSGVAAAGAAAGGCAPAPASSALGATTLATVGAG